MNRLITVLAVAIAAPVAWAQLGITPVDAFAEGGGNGGFDSDLTGESIFFGNQDSDIETETVTALGRTTLTVDAGIGTSGGILDISGSASGFAQIRLDIPQFSSRAEVDDETAIITASATAFSSIRTNDIGDFEGGFLSANGFANAAIAFDTSERLFAFAMGDFLSLPGTQPVTVLEPGRHIISFGINAPLSVSGDGAVSGIDLELTNTFEGHIVLSSVPSPSTALVMIAPALSLRRRR